MLKRVALAGSFAVLAASTALADFTYQQTSKITGGAMQSMMKVAGVFSKQAREAREPITTMVAVKGDRMAHIIPGKSAFIINLGAQTITNIDYAQKTYSVLTFEQYRAFLTQLESRNNKDAGEITVKPGIKDTGAKRQVAGYDAHQLIVTIDMEATDKNGKTNPMMSVVSDMWLAKVPGYEEVQAFQRKLAEQLAFAPSVGGMFSQAGTQKGMAELMKESSKLDGVPVFQITKMGAPQGAAAAQQEGQPAQAQQPQPQQQQAEEKPGVGGAIGKLGRFGGLGGFGRKKKQEEPAQTQQASQTQNQQSGAPGSLLEMETELAGFSTSAVDASKFEVPAGFKQVESEMGKRR